MHPSPVYPCELELPPASQYYIRGLSVVLVLVFVFVFVFVCFVCVCTSLRPLCIQSLFTPASSPLHLKRQNASQASREQAAAALKAKNLQIYPLQDANMFVRASRASKYLRRGSTSVSTRDTPRFKTCFSIEIHVLICTSETFQIYGSLFRTRSL